MAQGSKVQICDLKPDPDMTEIAVAFESKATYWSWKNNLLTDERATNCGDHSIIQGTVTSILS